MTVRVEVLDAVDDPALGASLQRLLTQLSSSAPPLTGDRLATIVGSSACTVFVASGEDGRPVGMLTLAVFPVPSGLRAWIEDVVVDGDARGRGIGEELVRRAIEHARTLEARTVDLTSRPSRTAANALYRKIRFIKRETNVYRYELG